MWKFSLVCSLSALILLAVVADGFSQSSFYEGKTILLVVGTDAGGSGDLRTRAVLPLLKKHIPGNPTIVVQYMPGAGGRKAANHIYKAVRPDGLTIGAMLTGMLQGAVFGEADVLYDINKIVYLGSHARYAPYVFLSRKGSGLSNKEKLSAAPGVRIGAPSVGHSLYTVARLFAYLLDMKEPKFVTGYSPPEVDMALDRGEVDAKVSIVDSAIVRNPHWFEKDLIDLHAILQIPKETTHSHPRIAKLPDLEKFARSQNDERIIDLFRGMRASGQPFILPPGTPTDRVQVLQEAMRRTLRDPDYVKAYEKLTSEPATPLWPEAFEKALRQLPREPELIELFKKFAGPGPLPSR
jgi:tripartite-type tricarboxylate transporter receptor subunit TctC